MDTLTSVERTKFGSVWIDENGLVNANIPFKLKDFGKKVLGYKWVAGPRWTWPSDPKTCYQLYTTLPYSEFQFYPAFLAKVQEWKQYSEGVLTQAHAAKTDDGLPPIPGEVFTAWNHQKQAFHFAKELPSAMLAMEMGTGKTKVTLDLMRNWDCKKILIICPKAVVPVWPREFDKHFAANARVTPLLKSSEGNKAQVKKILDGGERRATAFVINYESAWRGDCGKLLAQIEWDCVVLDESHKVKTHDSKVGKWARTLKSKKRLCLTGTPIGNNVEDIWGQYAFLDPSIYGRSFWQFRAKYGVQSGHQWYYSEKSVKQIKGLMHTIAFHAGKDLLDLPEFIDIERHYEMSAPVFKAYNEIERYLMTIVDQIEVKSPLAVTTLLKQQQIISGFVKPESGAEPVTIDEVNRLEALTGILDEIEDEAPADPLVVFYRFKHEAKILNAFFTLRNREEPCELSGSANTLAEWQRGERRILLVQIQSGSAGIDLTRSNRCIYYSLDFSLTNYEQSRARVHRPGQTKTTYYYTILSKCPGNVASLDDRIYYCLGKKMDLLRFMVEQIKKAA